MCVVLGPREASGGSCLRSHWPEPAKGEEMVSQSYKGNVKETHDLFYVKIIGPIAKFLLVPASVCIVFFSSVGVCAYVYVFACVCECVYVRACLCVCVWLSICVYRKGRHRLIFLCYHRSCDSIHCFFFP